MADDKTNLNRYERETPYAILGVAPDADARALRSAYTELERDVRESGLSVAERSRKKERLESAYNKVCTAATRIRVDFFLLDPSIGVRQCETIAKSVSKPDTKIDNLVKPRQIRVSYEALLDYLSSLYREPPKLSGLHPKPMDAGAELYLPEPLQVQFDC